MTEPFLGEIRTFAGNFAPANWALCDGSLLPINRYTALFSILGTSYGGDGKVTFGLPNLQGSAPMHWGDGPGLTSRTIGESGGSPTVTVLQNEMPAHNHPATSTGSDPDQASPAGNVLGDVPIFAAPPLDQVMAPGSIGLSGGSQPHNNMAPYLAVTFIIALQGIFPARG
jgi:microcystin-dependent protein